MTHKILIIGGGISGIYLAHLLKKKGFSIKIIEANKRIGGRIYTKKTQNTNIELGATWLWRYNPQLFKLCKDLNISLFEQSMNGDALFEANSFQSTKRFQIPKNQEISYRIIGGTSTLLNKLSEHISENELKLNEKVIEIQEENHAVKVITENTNYYADLVISTIPPQLLVNSVKFNPNLDKRLIQVANNTHTWMKDSIKFGIIYKTPFWLEKGLSGVCFSNVGPITEMYNHSDFENKQFALMGFINNKLTNETKTIREEKIKKQLFNFFGEEGVAYVSYEEKVWSNEDLLNYENEHFLTPHLNNGNSIYQEIFLNNKFIVAGSETSPSYGGYMEGAIYRGNQILEKLKILKQ
jgi:monoamine oxidase